MGSGYFTMTIDLSKVAFIEGNRVLNQNNVCKHKESLKKFGRNLVPLLYVDAKDVSDRAIYDASTGEKVGDKYGWIVVIDGQHRYKAALELSKEGQFDMNSLKWEKVDLTNKDILVDDVLIEVNSRTQPWRGKDYINGEYLRNPYDEVAKFACELTNTGLSAKTTNKYLFFKDKFSWSNPVDKDKANLDRAKTIWNVVKEFPDNIMKKSIIIDYIISEGGEGHWQEELNKVKRITINDKDLLKDSKAKELRNVFGNIVNK